MARKGLYKRKDSACWWMSFSVNGRSYNRSTGTDDEKLAKKILSKVETQIVEGKWFDINEAQKRRYDEMMDRFMEEHAPTQSASTQRSYARARAHLDKFFSGMTLAEITEDKVMQYVTSRRNAKKKSAPATRNRERAMLSKAFNLARLWKWTRENPCALVPQEKEHNENTGRCLTDEQEAALLTACEGRCNGQLKDIVLLALNTGCRESELLQMRWARIDFKAMTFSVIQKGNTEKIVSMNNTVFEILTRKNKVRALSGYVFTTGAGTPYIPRNMYREFQAAIKSKSCIEAGLEGFRFHDLRHTAGTRLARAGMDIHAIASFLGHYQLSTSRRYAKHNPASNRRAAEALERPIAKDGTNG